RLDSLLQVRTARSFHQPGYGMKPCVPIRAPPSKAPTRMPSRIRSRSKYSHSSIAGDMPLPDAAWSAANAGSSSRRTTRTVSSVTRPRPVRQVEDVLVRRPPPGPANVVEAIVVEQDRQRHPVPGGHPDVVT